MTSSTKLSEFLLTNYCRPNKVPFFLIKNNQMGTINSAIEFYTVLIKGIRESRFRINLSTLYIGTGPMEEFMFNEILKASNRNQFLKVNLIVDRNRGCRKSSPNGHSSFSLFQSILEKAVNPQNLHLSLFQHNELSRRGSFSIASGLNEVSGTFHLKQYIFDDTVILSGANLSEEYFTTRTDRYLYINNDKILCDFLDDFNQIFIDSGDKATDALTPEEVWKKISVHKENVARQFSVFLFNSFSEKSLEDLIARKKAENDKKISVMKNERTKKTEVSDLALGKTFNEDVIQIFKNAQNETEISANYQKPFHFYLEKYLSFDEKQEKGSSFLIPSFQMSLIGYSGEERLFADLIQYVFKLDGSLKFELTFTTGYFNPSDHLKELFLSIPDNITLKIVTAAPSANSFFNAKGAKGQVCSMYRCALINWIKNFEKKKNVQFFEFKKSGKTYHGKGVWLKCLNNPDQEYLTIYGSSNYSNRSYKRDLEGQFYIITEDPEKIAQFELEREEIMMNCEQIDGEVISKDTITKVGFMQRLFYKVLGNYL